ncbi:MAG: PRC-barrel domain-containing protein, partial [Vicinamibacteria bacterium]
KPVNNSRWEQVARVERLLFDPESGRATFVVVSFVGRDGLLAVPWREISVDSRGRARLVAEERALRQSIPFHGASVTDRPPRFEGDERLLDGEETRGTEPGFRIESGDEAILQGTIVGRVSLPAEKGGRRAQALLDVGTETLRVDLGPEKVLDSWARSVGPGDQVRILARRTEVEGGHEFMASEVRVQGATFVIERLHEP